MPERGEVDWDRTDKSKFLLYGGLFTVGVDFILYPLELLKTRVQVEAKSRATLFEASVSAYRGVLQQNGVRGLWTGFPLYTIGGLPSQGAYFYGYQWAVSRCTAWNSSRSENSRLPLFMIDMAAGFFADVVAAPLWTPTEVVSSRLQIQGPGVVKYDGALHAVRHIFATEGFPGFFRGISVSILAFGPASALWWAMYQACNRNLTAAYHSSYNESADTNVSGHVWIEALSGLVAGTVSSIVTNPLDIAKTRLQTQHVLLQDYDLMDSVVEKKDGNKRGSSSTKMLNVPKQNALLKAPLRMTSSAALAAAAHLKKPGKTSDPAKLVNVLSVSTQPSAAPVSPVSTTHTLSLPSVGGGGVPFRASILSDINAVEIAAAETRERVEAAARDDARRVAARGTMAPHGGGGGVINVGSGSLSSSSNSSSSRLTSLSTISATSSTGGPRLPLKDAPLSRLARTPSKSRIRTSTTFQSASSSSANKARLQTGLFSVLSDIYRRDGARALLRGLFPRMLMQGPASAATFVCFEQVKRLSISDQGKIE